MRSIARFATWIVTTTIGLASARADSYYVDVVHGDDANGGSSHADAWRTLTHALAVVPDSVPPEEQVIHVAPGTYSLSSGEVFPLVVGPGRRIVAEGGPGSTRVDGEGVGRTLFRIDAYPTIYPFAFRTTVAGFELRNGSTGVLMRGDSQDALATLEALDIRGMIGAGIEDWSLLHNSDLTLRNVVCIGNDAGLFAFAGTNGTGAVVLLEGCTLSQNVDRGVYVAASAAGVSLRMLRSRVEQNGGSGLMATASLVGGGSVEVEDCLVARNGGGGLGVSGSSDGAHYLLRLDRSTVADNGHDGVSTYMAVGTIAGSIVFGNAGADVYQADYAPTIAIEYSDIGDGDRSGANGNIAADPLFLDAASGDYRLRFGSPCVDVGQPDAPADLPDLAGAPRPIDGSLDTIERADMGAFELAPLVFTGDPTIGGLLRVELWGPTGANTVLWASRVGLVDPQPTPFGEFDLAPGTAFPLVRLSAQPGPPALFERPIPSDAILIGRTVSMQALIESGAAPAGAAWSNAISFVIDG